MLFLASGVAIVTKWIKLPYSIALVIVGLLIGLFHFLPVVTMTPELIMLVFLPALLFEASWNLHLDWLKTCYKPVALLATFGVFLSCAVVGVTVCALTGLELKIGLLFGAMISATDPISVLALFKRLRVNKRLHTILEGESLVNDGTAVALFRVLLAAILLSGDLSLGKVVADFALMTLGGTLVGAAIGLIASKLTQYFDDHLLETTLTVLVAYGSYILGEQLHVSSVISVLVAGFIMGNFGSRRSMSSTTRLAVNSFWEYAAFISESLIFLLIGMQIKFALVMKYFPYIAAGIVAILIARDLVVYALIPVTSEKRYPVPFSWQHLLFWGGLRGSLCMAMALSLPAAFPQREMLVVTTFGVALFTLLIPGLTMEPLVQLLKLKGHRPAKAIELQTQIVKLETEKRNLAKAAKNSQLPKKEFKQKSMEIDLKINDATSLLEMLDQGENNEQKVERLIIETALLQAQKDCLLQIARKSNADPTILNEFREKIDLRHVQIQTEQSEHSLKKETQD